MNVSSVDRSVAASTGAIAMITAALFLLSPIVSAGSTIAVAPEAARTVLLWTAITALPGTLLLAAAASLRRCGYDEAQLVSALRRLRTYFVVQVVLLAGSLAFVGVTYAIARGFAGLGG